ncbi:thiamin pyrophosphokinase 1-like [Gigantopelta aegis]|uniref:thiamin pyrophosphokinase 1-like n=1 Tax=Gigantopelta aegis TaxID=1735272 RepID=UPI001B889A34|nr:thiamin pyrophosphokinase 1-like [Gigantopelta aegis]
MFKSVLRYRTVPLRRLIIPIRHWPSPSPEGHNMATRESRVLHPLSWLLPDKDKDICLVLLNNQIDREIKLLKQLWRKALFVSCVDGAVNRLFDSLGDDRDEFIPHLISGDFDSARPEVLEFYKNKGTEVVETADQDLCDFTKNLQLVLSRIKSLECGSIVTFGGIGGSMEGRADHLFGNINTLFETRQLIDKPVYLASGGCLICLVNEGHTTIKVDTGFEGAACGLIPIGGPCDHVTTTGLKWNLDNQRLQFGELISTSNTFLGSAEVTIQTDTPVLWTMQYDYNA